MSSSCPILFRISSSFLHMCEIELWIDDEGVSPPKYLARRRTEGLRGSCEEERFFPFLVFGKSRHGILRSAEGKEGGRRRSRNEFRGESFQSPPPSFPLPPLFKGAAEKRFSSFSSPYFPSQIEVDFFAKEKNGKEKELGQELGGKCQMPLRMTEHFATVKTQLPFSPNNFRKKYSKPSNSDGGKKELTSGEFLSRNRKKQKNSFFFAGVLFFFTLLFPGTRMIRPKIQASKSFFCRNFTGKKPHEQSREKNQFWRQKRVFFHTL